MLKLECLPSLAIDDEQLQIKILYICVRITSNVCQHLTALYRDMARGYSMDVFLVSLNISTRKHPLTRGRGFDNRELNSMHSYSK